MNQAQLSIVLNILAILNTDQPQNIEDLINTNHFFVRKRLQLYVLFGNKKTLNYRASQIHVIQKLWRAETVYF